MPYIRIAIRVHAARINFEAVASYGDANQAEAMQNMRIFVKKGASVQWLYLERRCQGELSDEKLKQPFREMVRRLKLSHDIPKNAKCEYFLRETKSEFDTEVRAATDCLRASGSKRQAEDRQAEGDLRATRARGTCWLCGEDALPSDCCTLGDCLTQADTLRMLARRYAGHAHRLVHKDSCGSWLKTGEAQARQCHSTAEGRGSLAAMEAHKKWDKDRVAEDSKSVFHPGVQFQKHCASEPTEGRTPEEVRTAIRELEQRNEGNGLTCVQKLTTLAKHYINKHTPDERSQELAVRKGIEHMTPFESLQSYLAKYHVGEFFQPFHHLMALTLDIAPSRKLESLAAIEQGCTTAYGGGRLINSMFFRGVKVVSEGEMDMKGLDPEPPALSFGKGAFQGRPNTVLALILFNSPFGQKLMAIDDFCLPMENEYVRFQRFCFKICEIRKTCTESSRWHWRWGAEQRAAMDRVVPDSIGSVLRTFSFAVRFIRFFATYGYICPYIAIYGHIWQYIAIICDYICLYMTIYILRYVFWTSGHVFWCLDL